MCELLSGSAGYRDKESYFVVGLFSILEALLDLPIDRALDNLPLTEDVVQALSKRKGLLGEALECTLACEECRFTGIHFGNLETEIINQAYIEAMSWSRRAAV